MALPDKVTVFTTRPDTLFGATYLVLAPEHPLITYLESRISNLKEVKAYGVAAAKKTEIERQGSREKPRRNQRDHGENPATGEQIPVWIADYVLGGYGTGAIMASPRMTNEILNLRRSLSCQSDS